MSVLLVLACLYYTRLLPLSVYITTQTRISLLGTVADHGSVHLLDIVQNRFIKKKIVSEIGPFRHPFQSETIEFFVFTLLKVPLMVSENELNYVLGKRRIWH